MSNILTLEQILNESLWVAKLSCSRSVGTYAEVFPLFQADENARDFDLCAEQPEHLKEFFKLMEAFQSVSGWMTIEEFYPLYFSLKTKGYIVLPTEQ